MTYGELNSVYGGDAQVANSINSSLGNVNLPLNSSGAGNMNGGTTMMNRLKKLLNFPKKMTKRSKKMIKSRRFKKTRNVRKK